MKNSTGRVLQGIFGFALPYECCQSVMKNFEAGLWLYFLASFA